ncbi:MAG: tetratricopeptide repeat protein [bacterium]|nr:tetratricopeptide repeat protein [bacterium]
MRKLSFPLTVALLPIILLLYMLIVLPTPAKGATSVAAEMYDAGNAAVEAQNWEKAATILDALTKENPYNGDFWYDLAGAHYSLKNYDASIVAYQKAVELGRYKGGSLYNMGCCYALTGQAEKAVDAIEASFGYGLQGRENLIREDSDLDSIRKTKAFQERILPGVPDGISRVDGWRLDLDYLHRRMEVTHFDLYRNVSPEEWRSTLDALAANVPNMKDHEIVVELMKLYAKIGDGHTGVRPPKGKNGWHRLPVEFYIFKDGVFVRSADEKNASIIGKRVVRVGKLPVEEALARCATVTQRDNTQQIKWLAPIWMASTEVLDALDIIDGVESATLVLADADGRESKVRVDALPLSSFYNEHGRFSLVNAVTMNDNAVGPKPLWLKDPDKAYWFEYLEDEKLVYFQFNRVRNAEQGESLSDFSKRLFAFVEENDVEALVIDVRENNGGNNFLVRPILHRVIPSKVNEDGRVFMIIGRETFSACQNFTNRMQWHTKTMYVGEPTGSRPNFVGEGNKIILPYTGLVVRGSSRYWQDSLSDDYRTWVAPDLVAEMTSDEFRNNEDPCMDVIMAYLKNRRVLEGDRAER